MKSILIVGPLPPPHTGNSLPIDVLRNHWNSKGYNLTIYNTSKELIVSGIFSLRRVYFWIEIYFHLFRKKNTYDLIYYSISESLLGNLRDILFYSVSKKSIEKISVHLLGGNSFKTIIQSKSLIGALNRHFLSKVGNIIVESSFQKSFFAGSIFFDRVSIIENFAQKEFFLSNSSINEKFNTAKKINLLFVSNLLFGKGHHELVDAFLSLPHEIRKIFHLDIAGNLIDDPKSDFIKKINSDENITFHGFINGLDKVKLFHSAHFFCLPTYYPYEGLPFSIIESYASGCIGIITEHSGIPCIFSDKINGFKIDKRSVQSIIDVLINIHALFIKEREHLILIAQYNHQQALERNKEEIFINAFDKILKTI